MPGELRPGRTVTATVLGGIVGMVVGLALFAVALTDLADVMVAPTVTMAAAPSGGRAAGAPAGCAFS